VHPLPEGFSDTELAPLLCVGIIGYWALLRAEIPPGGSLGIWGFGGSAHLAAQIAIAQGAAVHVFTRAQTARDLALSLGAASAQDSCDPAPEPLDSAIIFAPVGDMVPPAPAALGRGGHAGDRRHLPDPDPAAGLHQGPVPGADGAQRHRQHPG
jgi:alcohol dehydrogenase, propanol-preferring